MFWLDRVFGQIETSLAEKIRNKERLLIRDEKTASGRVHVGSMRALGLHAAISERLEEAKIPHEFRYEINDMDPMDGLPSYLDQEKYAKEMGKPLFAVPAPDGTAKNFAEYFAEDYIAAIHEAGFAPLLYRASELYFSGQMNGAIRHALEKAATVRKIYEEVSGAKRPGDWLPVTVICENCGKMGTTRAFDFDGETVAYACEPRLVAWAEGCEHSGRISPFDGNAKLHWKVDWPAKWFVLGVDIEGGGKDHFTKGGSRDVGKRITTEVFDYPEPFGVANEFFLVGGKRMSSSRGQGSSARDVVTLVPPRIFRLALFGKDINQQINFDPKGDTIPLLFDQYDRLAAKYWEGVRDDDSRLFEYIHAVRERAELPEAKRFLPRFSQVAFAVQMPHLNLRQEIEKMKGAPLTEKDIEEGDLRAEYARRWLEKAADEEYKFTLAEDGVPESAKNLSEAQKKALGEVREALRSNQDLTGSDFHALLHEIRQASPLSAQEFFGALYLSFLGKPSGPKAGWFLGILPREFVLHRLDEVSR
ncbi:MAG: lysine--tRNA ligase [Patescibacteria group bacterium]|nr:lysine--tRNA ligase [Patescibacteria group bacterium]